MSRLWLLLIFTILLSVKPSHSFQFTSNAWYYTTQRNIPVTTVTSLHSSSSNGNNKVDDNNNNNIEFYKNQAEQLRNEIEQFEQQKRKDNELYQQQQNDILQQQKQLQDRYSAIVPILKPDGATVMERCTFTPIYTDGTSYITTIESDLPLGIIIGEVTTNDTPYNNDNHDTSNTVQRRQSPYIIIDEVTPNSNGEINGLLVGDIIHACTACKVDMELPTWQLLLGGIGRPKTNRYMHSVNNVVRDTVLTPSMLFENTMNAIASNRFDPEQRPILLVIERRCEQ